MCPSVIVKLSSGLNRIVTCPLSVPDHAGLQELEDVQEEGEENDWEDIDKQSLLERGVVELQSARYWDPKQGSEGSDTKNI